MPPIVLHDVTQRVGWAIANGYSIVTGAALNVDYTAAGEVLRLCPSPSRLTVMLPTAESIFFAHIRAQAQANFMGMQVAEVEAVIDQIGKLRQWGANIVELPATVCDMQSYDDCHTAILGAATQLSAFVVDDSQGVLNGVKKAEARNMPVTLKRYYNRPATAVREVMEE